MMRLLAFSLIATLIPLISGGYAALAAPSAPTITSIAGGNTYLSIAFTAPASGTPTNYDYSLNGGSTWTTLSPAATTSPIVVTGLTNGTTYSVQLRARDATGPGTASATVTGRPAALTAPVIGTIVGGSTYLQIPFTAPTAGAPTNYDYSLNGGSTWTTLSPASTTSPILVTGLVNGTTYTVQLRARDLIGNGPASTSVSGRPTALTAPVITSVTGGNTYLEVAFTASAGAPTNYDYSINGGLTWITRNPAGTWGPINDMRRHFNREVRGQTGVLMGNLSVLSHDRDKFTPNS